MTQPATNPLRPAILLWVFSFICALYPVNAWQLELFGISVVTLLVWAAYMLVQGSREGWKMSRSPVMILAAAFWILAAVSVFWSPAKPVSLIALCYFSVMPLGFLIGAMTGDEGYFKKIAYFLAPVFAVLSVWAVIQYFFLNTYFLGQARHPLADPSSLGALFSLALFCAMGWMIRSRGTEHKLAVTLCLLIVCGILSTVARGPLFALVPGLLLFGTLLWPQVRACRKSFLVVLVGAAAFFAVMHMGIEKKYDLATRVAETISPADASADVTSNRLTVWKTTLEIIRDHPFLGTGIGTYYLHYPQYQTKDDQEGAYLAHNDPLQFWAEMGISGPLLFYAFVIAAGMRMARALKAFKPLPGAADENLRVAGVSIFAALASMVAGSHVGFNLYNLSILSAAGFLLSAWFVVTRTLLREQPGRAFLPSGLSPAAGAVTVALPFLMIGWLFASLIAGEHFANSARDNLFRQNMAGFADDINKAGRMSHNLSYRTFLLAVNVPMTILKIDADQGKKDMATQAQLYAQVNGYMRDVISLNPLEPSAYYYLGLVQDFVDKSVVPEGTPTPEEYYEKALSLDPVYVSARMALYDLYKREGRPQAELIAVMEPGLNYIYTTPVAMAYYEASAKLFLENKNYGKAQAVMEKMAYFKKLELFSRQKQATTIPQALIGGDSEIARP